MGLIRMYVVYCLGSCWMPVSCGGLDDANTSLGPSTSLPPWWDQLRSCHGCI